MTEVKTSFSWIKKSNLVYLLEKAKDLNKLDSLKLDKKILGKIKETIKENKSTCLNFFLWDQKFENLHVLFYSKKDNKSLWVFLAKHLINFPESITLLSNESNNLKTLLETSILARYKFQKYKSEKKKFTSSVIVDKKDKEEIEEKLSTLENVLLARELAETPANDLTPEDFVKIVKKTKFKKTKVRILTPKDLQKKWLNLLWAVWKWSKHKPYMVILERIVDKKYPTYGLIWKWITFDTGWIQVKPENYMYDMKWDMCWAAATFATMKELDTKDLNVNIIACLCLAENHISGESFKPSDIFTSYSWKTVDIGHTDAEWRLVLADGISYVSKNYKTDHIMTIATLTWACLYALGYRHAWIMWDDEGIISSLLKNNTQEMYWRLPFDDYFIEKTKDSDIADLSNIDRWVKAWSTMWGAFLYNFRMNKEKYTHIDIAWTAINSHESWWILNKWMTGFWVLSLSNLFLNLKK